MAHTGRTSKTINSVSKTPRLGLVCLYDQSVERANIDVGVFSCYADTGRRLELKTLSYLHGTNLLTRM